MRLGDLAIPPEENGSGRRRFPWRLSRPGNNRSQIVLFLGVLAIPVIAMIIFGILLSTRSFRSPSVNSPTGEVYAAEQSLSKRNALPDSVEAPDGAASTRSENSAQVESRPDDLKYLPGAAPFVTAGVIRELQLTDAQLKKIRGILDETDKVIAENENCRVLFDLARQEAMNLLTDQQRQRWGAGNSTDKLRN
jgi:hypothetical protein